MSHFLQTIFIRIYTLLKLNLFFWLFSALGGIVFGIGPAILTVTEMLASYNWDYQEVTIKVFFDTYKENFRRGNALFITGIGFFALSSYNLYLSVQLKGLGFIIIDFILIASMVFIILVFAFSQVVFAKYDISFRQGLKLAIILFFSNFLKVLQVIVGIVVIVYFTYKNPAFILFGSFAGTQTFIIWSTKKFFEQFDLLNSEETVMTTCESDIY